jgi:hypothetical protein
MFNCSSVADIIKKKICLALGNTILDNTDYVNKNKKNIRL